MRGVLSFLKSAGIYFAGNVLTRMISFFLLPLYTAFIVPADMGYYDTSLSYLNILMPVVCMEIWTAIMRFMYRSEEEDGKYRVVYQGLLLFSVSALVYSGLFVLLRFVRPELPCFWLIYAYGMLTMLQNIYSFVTRGFGKNRLFALSGLCGSLCASLANIVMIVFLGLRLQSLYWAAILGLVLQIGMMESRVGLLRHWRGVRLERSLLREMTRFALPLALNSACFWFLSGYNKVGLTNELGAAANGLYAVAARFTTAVSLISTCFSLAWQELAYSVGDREGDKSRFYSTASDYYLRFLIAGLLLLVPLVRVIFPWMVADSYAEAENLVPLYLFATVASVYSTFLGSIFAAENKTNIVFTSTLCAAVVNVSLFHLLVGSFGIQAANIALLTGFAVNILVRLWVLRSSVPVRIRWQLPVVLLVGFGVDFVCYCRCSRAVNALLLGATLLLCVAAFLPMLRELLQILRCRRSQKGSRN